jgi:parallel beta-helix repeat protein
MKKSISIIVIGLLLTLCFSVNTASSVTIKPTSSGATLYVDDDFNESAPGWNITSFDMIQSAIDNASVNDTVFVYNGLYNESIVINKSLTLTGENNQNTIISSDLDELTIFIDADFVEISNFKIVSKGRRGRSINLQIKGNSKISNNTIESDYAGIDLYHSNNNEILNNYIFKCSIQLSQSDYNILSYNYFSGDGCILYYSHDNELTHNIIESANVGISSGGGVRNIISYNILRFCDYVILVGFEDESTISYNDFLSNNNSCWDSMIHSGSCKWAVIASEDCTWEHNYWGRPRILPKIIWSFMAVSGFVIDFDWHPALRPNCE